MKPEIVTLCHAALEDTMGLSILGAFAQIKLSTLPYPFPAFALACRLRFDADETGIHALNLTLVDPDGRILGKVETEFKLLPVTFPPTTTLTLVCPMKGMELRSYGEHMIDLMFDSELALRVPFYVVKQTG